MTYRERYSFQSQKSSYCPYLVIVYYHKCFERVLSLRRAGNIIAEDRIRDWDGHIIADGRRFILIHPHVIDGSLGNVADDLFQDVVTGNNVCMHCRRRVVLHERIAGYIRHSHTL